jgi:hypothetical protein
MKIDTVEQRLLQSIRSRIMNPDAVHYLIRVVKQHLHTFWSREEETRRDLDRQLQRVDEELRNIERAILAGVWVRPRRRFSRIARPSVGASRSV